MVTLTHRLASLKPTLLKVSYTVSHKPYLVNYIAINEAHPLHIAQRRRKAERKREGLWWHATTGVDVSKFSCVRTWVRRRLAHAFVESLQDRGYDETGRLVNMSKIQDDNATRILTSGRSVNLVGCLRMHGVPAIVPAKYAAVKEEVSSIVDAIVQAAIDAALNLRGEEDRPPRMKPTVPPSRKRTTPFAAPRVKRTAGAFRAVKPPATGLADVQQEFAMPSKPGRTPKSGSTTRPSRAAPRTNKSSKTGIAGA